MIGIDIIRNNPDSVRIAMDNRGQAAQIDRVIELDATRRALIMQTDKLKSRRNDVSRNIGQQKNVPQELIEEMRRVGAQIKQADQEIKGSEEEIKKVLLEIPNIPDDDVPIGRDETSNVLVKTVGEKPSFDFTPLPHWELGVNLGIIDFERGAKLSGSRFYVLNGMGAKLQRALIDWMLDLHVDQNGYQEMYLPYMVNSESAIGSGQLPKFSDTMYHDAEDDLWMVPTAEVPLTNLHKNEIIDPGTLPIKYVAHTPCFRREKAAAGRDTRGIKRVHQFEKVELFQFVEPDFSGPALLQLTADAVQVCFQLGLHHRVVELCTGELGSVAAKSYDIEIWAPGSSEWLEVSSCSNCRDYQARRAKIRYRSSPEGRPEFVHTLNGSGLALPRVLIGIIESGQQPDGSIVIPEVLHEYTGFKMID